MAISWFSINISANEPIPKMQRVVKDIRMTVRINQFEFDGRIQRINIFSNFQQFRYILSPNMENIISLSPPKHCFWPTPKFGFLVNDAHG